MLNGWKTYIAALVPIVFGVIQMTDWNAFLANPKAGIVALGSGILMAVMRWITTQTTNKVG